MARIKSLGVIQNAKFAAVMYFIFTAIIIIPMGLIMILAGSVSGSKEGLFGAMFGGAFMLLLPFLYALLGFIFAAIGCLIYNLIAKLVGGIEIEIE